MEEILNKQSSVLGINDFLLSAKEYTKTAFPDLDITELFTNSLSGNITNVFEIKNIVEIFSSEIKGVIELIVSVLIIIIIHSIFKAITENLGSSSSSQVVYFIQYLLVTTVILNYFFTILDLTRSSISNVVSFMNLLIPLMITLMLTTGTIVTTSVVQPVLIIMVNFIGNFINSFLIPMLLISMTISIVSNISDKIQIGKLSNFLKSSIVWILGIVLTIFSCTLSLEGTLTSSVDGLTAKTAKAAVSNFIPAVGKIMGDTVDSVIGCGNVLKNAVGIIGVIIIVGIVVVPIIRILALWVSFKLTAAVCEVVADVKIVKLIEQFADSYKILLAILFSVSIMFIIGITLVVKITNGVLMYR
jgi:stage III sporulation protein AE